MLGAYLSHTVLASETNAGRWVLEALQELQLSVSFVAAVHGPEAHTLEALAVVERLVGDSSGAAARSPSIGACAVAVVRGLLPGAAAAAAAADGNATAPLASSSGSLPASPAPAYAVASSDSQPAAASAGGGGLATDFCKRRLMPPLMVLLARGEPPVQVGGG